MQLNRMIDHTFLKPNATPQEYEAFFKAALAFNFVSVAVLPTAVPPGYSYLKGSSTHLMAAISYPRGMIPTLLKLREFRKAAGGIGSLDQLAAMVRAGAERIGTSSGPAILDELRSRSGDFDRFLGDGS